MEKAALNYLRSLGQPWLDLFKAVAALDLKSPNLKQELLAERAIDRRHPGFADFDPNSPVGIAPGDPASSLLYHALASPLVKPNGASQADYPTVADLDLIENYILSLAPMAAAAIPQNAVVAVLAYEYRPAAWTTHRRQADFVYSRSGFSRVGEEAPVWDGGNRCWLNINPATGRFAVRPARYAAFLAIPCRRSPTRVSVLGDAQDGDDKRTFLLPVRKLFEGPGCVNGTELDILFDEFHRREKLRRIFTESNLPRPPGLDQPPYLRDSTQVEKIAITEQAGASLLVSSKAEPLVRLARLPSGDVATFTVPPRRALPIAGLPLNRNPGSPSTFMIITGGLGIAGVEEFLRSLADVDLRPRNAPEFVNMRHRPTGDPKRPVDDMSRDLGADYETVLDGGGYQAALFEDSIADGCIIANAGGLPFALPCKPAFSVIAAPRFFPYADESELDAWVDAFPSHNRRDQFKNGPPSPLCLGRFPPNLTLFWPGTTEPRAFSPSDDTAVAIVGTSYAAQSGPTQPNLPARDASPGNRTTTYLSDCCSDVFAPGWDITFAEENGSRFYATFGLGSPFPEDVKLCAADSAFWPAASPDAARTFNRGPTAIPMLDAELGYHPDNPRRQGPPSFGWDGEQGPFIAGNAVNFASLVRSDYVSHAFSDHTFSGTRLAGVDSDELIRRMDALRLCIQTLPEDSKEVDHTKLWLVHADKLDQAPAAAGIAGACYRYEFVVPQGKSASSPGDARRLLIEFGNRYVCYVAGAGVSWARSEAGPFTFFANPGV
ncbi:MAG: hypothetical protein JOZ17_07880 [Acetobacteraceae bacterium]|nr:hypothetical protein [Acetobacteraceae bacterium]